MQGMQAPRISWPIGTHFSTRAATSGAYDELAVDDDDKAATILAAFAANHIRKQEKDMCLSPKVTEGTHAMWQCL